MELLEAMTRFRWLRTVMVESDSDPFAVLEFIRSFRGTGRGSEMESFSCAVLPDMLDELVYELDEVFPQLQHLSVIESRVDVLPVRLESPFHLDFLRCLAAQPRRLPELRALTLEPYWCMCPEDVDEVLNALQGIAKSRPLFATTFLSCYTMRRAGRSPFAWTITNMEYNPLERVRWMAANLLGEYIPG
ncbi:hypothetical protein K466DRAFT_599163 [Polyporus arcularius HHB13444]|uniref:Uncharacterized protein n=1 Tax=Polyporus arcularius HHB13444 TaxID=1314778 RepID=A0A5C3PG42_9APHY|nr:hypothetical protein K466DRAFT_599163 [Polyporus arcularius HHB13444]